MTKISQLETLVDIDKSDHKLKDIAELFVNAARDWDTFNQTDISDFVKELKQYFGSPLTKEKITDKPLDNAWQHEAGSSIFQMLDLSERFYNQADFDKILSDILSYYEQQMQSIDFIADLKYLTNEEGGRKTPVFSTGYRPQIKFDFDEMQTSGQQTFLNKDTVYPGDTVAAAIRIISVEHFASTLTEGMTFEFREGSKIIGTGIITSILNNSLQKASR
ncbi:MAG TPA: hypothetical protein P5158_04855 [Chitinophagaceae bacterium]|nr:hypothetical protein [Chitinophagaceae bacterium]MCB9055673.1 hypothetical protein [Chitinophagales bacterium]HRX93420.1 hypothetical protein [Chitinophagaceae bacterium]